MLVDTTVAIWSRTSTIWHCLMPFCLLCVIQCQIPLQQYPSHNLLMLIPTKSMWRRLRWKIDWVSKIFNLSICFSTCILKMVIVFSKKRKRKILLYKKGLLVYAEKTAKVMANSSMLTPCHRFAWIAHNPYVNDKAVECIDLDDWVTLVYRHLDRFQYHPL